MQGKLIRDTKNKEVTFVKQQPMHPRDRLRKLTKNLESDAKTLKEIPYININTDAPIDTTENENKIMDLIIQSLTADNNRYCIKHEEGSNTFSIKEDPLWKEKDLFQLILNTDKRISRSNNSKTNLAELNLKKNKPPRCCKIWVKLV